ncbi:MAG: hypothetical protein J6Y78_17720 [Paludibacteraceae bacterium]|nr:hypothetical protein [Paludibacteraceae bacterium]
MNKDYELLMEEAMKKAEEKPTNKKVINQLIDNKTRIEGLMQNFIPRIKAGEINKETAVAELLDVYYQEWVDIYDDEVFPEEFIIPLKDRDCGIYEALSWLAIEKYDFDADFGGWSPLMQSVECADAPMTYFLIQNGADANKWPDMGEMPDWPEENYYLEDIDIKYLNESWPRTERYIKALLETAKVLLKEGGTGSYGGRSGFNADAEKHLIKLDNYSCEY